ncbi:MAG: efflux transporter periplasmic adaptor subunit, partial [Myxococcota bacterium]
AEDKRFVFVLESESEGLFRVRKVTVDLSGVSDRGFRVIAGLSGGERVATAGLRSLFDGQLVRLLPES